MDGVKYFWGVEQLVLKIYYISSFFINLVLFACAIRNFFMQSSTLKKPTTTATVRTKNLLHLFVLYKFSPFCIRYS